MTTRAIAQKQHTPFGRFWYFWRKTSVYSLEAYSLLMWSLIFADIWVFGYRFFGAIQGDPNPWVPWPVFPFLLNVVLPYLFPGSSMPILPGAPIPFLVWLAVVAVLGIFTYLSWWRYPSGGIDSGNVGDRNFWVYHSLLTALQLWLLFMRFTFNPMMYPV